MPAARAEAVRAEAVRVGAATVGTARVGAGRAVVAGRGTAPLSPADLLVGLAGAVLGDGVDLGDRVDLAETGVL